MDVWEVFSLLVGPIQWLAGGICLMVTLYRAFRGDVPGLERALILSVLFLLSAHIRMGGAL
jgi:hypothetical protein